MSNQMPRSELELQQLGEVLFMTGALFCLVCTLGGPASGFLLIPKCVLT